MAEISDTTLIVIVAISMALTSIGAFASVNGFSFPDGIASITGFATSQVGRANLTVTNAASITLSEVTGDLNSSAIELGTLTTGQTNYSDDEGVDDWWRVNNNGGVNISLEIYGTQPGGNQTANERGIGPFSTNDSSGGCLDAWATNEHTCFMVKCNSTQTGFDCNSTYYPLWTGQGGGQLAIDLLHTDGQDNASFGVNVTVPLSEGPGTKQQAVTFFAACSDASC